MNSNARRVLIERNKSILIHSDPKDIRDFLRTVNETRDLSEVGGYIIDTNLAIKYGLGKIIGTARDNTEKPIIYMAHAHAEDSDKFACVCAEARVDGVILKACDDCGISYTAYSLMGSGTAVIADCIGGNGSRREQTRMADSVSEAYRDAAGNGEIRDFVVPLRLMDSRGWSAWSYAVGPSGTIEARGHVYYADARDAIGRYNYAREFKDAWQWHIIISDGNIGGNDIRGTVNNCVMAMGGFGSMDSIDIEACFGNGEAKAKDDSADGGKGVKR